MWVPKRIQIKTMLNLSPVKYKLDGGVLYESSEGKPHNSQTLGGCHGPTKDTWQRESRASLYLLYRAMEFFKP